MQLYTVGCYKCGEFHAYESENRADERLRQFRDTDCRGSGDHDSLGIVRIDSNRVPLWE